MIVQCPSCGSRYRVNDANIPATGGKIRCPSCSHAFIVYPEAAQALFAEEDEDGKTSVAHKNNLQQLVKSMQQPGLGEETQVLDTDMQEALRRGAMAENAMNAESSGLSASSSVADIATSDSGLDEAKFDTPDVTSGAASIVVDSILSDEPEEETPTGIDASHEGPWKLKTDFGLTYEFPGTKGLQNWLQNHDGVDGYTVSADGQNFFPLTEVAQLDDILAAGQAGTRTRTRTSSGIDAPVATEDEEAHVPVHGETADDFEHKSLITTIPYRPPSRDAKWNKLLWAVFALLFVVAAILAADIAGVMDVKSMVLGAEPEQEVSNTPMNSVAEEPAQVQPVVQPGSALYNQILRSAQLFIEHEEYEQALEKLDEAIELNSEDPDAYALKADVYDILGDADNASAMRDKEEELSQE